MGHSYDAVRQAARERAARLTDGGLDRQALVHWGEDLAALRVSVHALEDRIELELPALHDELRQALAKAVQAAGETAAGRDRSAEDRFGRGLDEIRFGVETLTRRVGWAIGLAGAAAVLALARC